MERSSVRIQQTECANNQNSALSFLKECHPKTTFLRTRDPETSGNDLTNIALTSIFLYRKFQCRRSSTPFVAARQKHNNYTNSAWNVAIETETDDTTTHTITKTYTHHTAFTQGCAQRRRRLPSWFGGVMGGTQIPDPGLLRIATLLNITGTMEEITIYAYGIPGMDANTGDANQVCNTTPQCE